MTTRAGEGPVLVAMTGMAPVNRVMRPKNTGQSSELEAEQPPSFLILRGDGITFTSQNWGKDKMIAWEPGFPSKTCEDGLQGSFRCE